MGYFEIGKVVGTHGIKGTFKVYPTTEDPSRFELLKEVIFDFRENKEVFKIKNVAYHKNIVLLTVKEIDDINVALKYKDAKILIPDELALPLEEDEYYIRDLYDMEVYTEEGEYLGIISNIMETGSNDVYVITKEGTKDLLIPAIKDCIIKVDVAENKMTVKLMEGLR